MCNWKHWLVLGEKAAFSSELLVGKAAFSSNTPEEIAAFSSNDEWDYYDEEYIWRKLGLINRERNDIGF